MKLEEIHKWPKLTIYEAPEIGPDQPSMLTSKKHGLKDPSILLHLRDTNETIEGLRLFSYKVGNSIIFQLRTNDGHPLTMLVGEFIKNFPGPKRRGTIVIHRTETESGYRNRGYSTALIDGLASLGYRVVSDTQVSPAAQRVWDKLQLRRDVKFWDDTIQDYTDVNAKGQKYIRYVLEHKVFKQHNALLNDRIEWTSPQMKNILEHISEQS